MHRNKLIQSVSALLLMLVLLFSITPKKFLHDLIADHTDTISVAANDGQDHIDHHGFKCDCDNLVATSAFLSHELIPDFTQIRVFGTYATFYTSQCKATVLLSFSLRGPPATM